MFGSKTTTVRQDSKGSEVSGGTVRYDRTVTTNSDGSTHSTESVTTRNSSGRISWDTDKDGNVSKVHSNMNK
jgi:hypothetical protein